jgi:hypothetical protein
MHFSLSLADACKTKHIMFASTLRTHLFQHEHSDNADNSVRLQKHSYKMQNTPENTSILMSMVKE